MMNQLKRTLFPALLMLVLTACGGQMSGSNMANHSATTMPGMGGTAVGQGAMKMSNAPFDAMFIDSMLQHHRGAVAMAQRALQEGQHEELKQLAQGIIASQTQEIDQMIAWRKQWYPNLSPTGGMNMTMGDMQVSKESSQPFDQRFLTAMTNHHQGAISMAKEAQSKATHPELKRLATNIVKAQESEVGQMQRWQRSWYGG
ncbi:MAG: DUF305 domain-containing protein [Herpetosiphon sp.]